MTLKLYSIISGDNLTKFGILVVYWISVISVKYGSIWDTRMSDIKIWIVMKNVRTVNLSKFQLRYFREKKLSSEETQSRKRSLSSISSTNSCGLLKSNFRYCAFLLPINWLEYFPKYWSRGTSGGLSMKHPGQFLLRHSMRSSMLA